MHVNRKELARKVIDHTIFMESFSPVQFDHMPYAVATEMICSPTAKLSNPQRKLCSLARETRFSSQRERKPIQAKLENRFFTASLKQLQKWFQRSLVKRQGFQRQFSSLAVRIGELNLLEKRNPLQDYTILVAKRKQAEIDLAVAHLELVTDAISQEIKSRVKRE